MVWTTRRLSLVAALGLVCAGLALPAAAQWAWRDAAGRTVYSDQPPPANIRSDQILRQPSAQSLGTPNRGMAPEAPAADAKGETKDATKPAAPKTLAERELEFRKRMQANAEAEKKAAEEQAQNAQRAAECERMRGYLKALEDGMRIARTDAQGNRELLDDAQRASEITRVREAMGRSCS